MAASVTLRVIGPAVSCVCEMGTTPSRLISPSVGRMPTTEFQPDGLVIEPRVSVPTETAARLVATPTAEPVLDPNGSKTPGPYGFNVWPPTPLNPLGASSIVRKYANSDRLALPRIIAPASRNFEVRNASSGGMLFMSATEPAVVAMSNVSILSFSKTGMP